MPPRKSLVAVVEQALSESDEVKAKFEEWKRDNGIGSAATDDDGCGPPRLINTRYSPEERERRVLEAFATLGTVPMTDVAKHINETPGSTSWSIRKLVDRGLVERVGHRLWRLADRGGN